MANDEIFEDIFDEASALKKIDTNTSKTLSSLVRDMRELEEKIEDSENHLKNLKSQKHSLAAEQIPMLMDEMGVDRIDVDGLTVSTKLQVHASIPVARREEAYTWLRGNNLDSIIKNDVTVSFGKGEDNIAGDVVGLLQEKGFDPKTKTHVHASTLKAFVKERITDGKPIDLDLFGAYSMNTAEIRRK